MKTSEVSIIFHQTDVTEFMKVMSDPNPIYQSVEAAKNFGFKTMPLPPTMPLVAYKLLNLPWQLAEPILHRKQECSYHQTMYIGETYKAHIYLTEHTERKGFYLVKQSLVIVDMQGKLCFEGNYQIVCGGVI